MSTEKQQSIAIETLKVFYPIAYALGMPEVLQEISGHILKILRENLFNTYEEKCQEQQKTVKTMLQKFKMLFYKAIFLMNSIFNHLHSVNY